ncbi:MAG: hypothetical protein LBK56_03070 [Gracilibacteraceae bacterium]|nr:hypothetical protein [Gracilibacteraceae bacterium]
MVFKGPAGFGRIMNISMNTALCLAISFLILSVMQRQPGMEDIQVLTPAAYLQTFISSFVVAYTLADIIPAFSWGAALLGALRVRNKLWAHIILSIELGLVYAVSILFVCSFINNFLTSGMAGVIGFFLSFIPLILPLAMVLVVILLVPLRKMAVGISGFDPIRRNGA